MKLFLEPRLPSIVKRLISWRIRSAVAEWRRSFQLHQLAAKRILSFHVPQTHSSRFSHSNEQRRCKGGNKPIWATVEMEIFGGECERTRCADSAPWRRTCHRFRPERKRGMRPTRAQHQRGRPLRINRCFGRRPPQVHASVDERLFLADHLDFVSSLFHVRLLCAVRTVNRYETGRKEKSAGISASHSDWTFDWFATGERSFTYLTVLFIQLTRNLFHKLPTIFVRGHQPMRFEYFFRKISNIWTCQ